MSIDPRAANAIANAATQSKNMVLGLLLAFFFGSAGLCYTSCLLGIIGIILELIVWFFALLTFGLGWILIIPWHLFSMVMVVIIIHFHNERLRNDIHRHLG